MATDVGDGERPSDDSAQIEGDRALIRAMWQLPALCHFCQVFRSVLALPSFSPRHLESALLESYDAGSSNLLLPELFWKLTHCGTDLAKSKKIKADGFPDWQQSSFKLLRFVYEFDYSIPFQQISAKDKLLMLHSLCDRAFDAYPSMIQDSGKTVEEMRLCPFGRDSNKRDYHRFSDDAWIFTEKHKDYISHRLQSCAPIWELAATTTEELRALCSRLDCSDHMEQRELYCYLHDELLPSLEAEERNRIKNEYRKQLFALMPKRQSSRIQSKQEEEERRQQEEQEEMERKAERQKQRQQARDERRLSLLAEQELSPRDSRAIRAISTRPLRSNTSIEDPPKPNVDSGSESDEGTSQEQKMTLNASDGADAS